MTMSIELYGIDHEPQPIAVELRYHVDLTVWERRK